MVGGASQLATFDLTASEKVLRSDWHVDIFSKKDLDGLSPEKTYTNKRIGPVFSFKRYGQSGAWVSESSRT